MPPRIFFNPKEMHQLNLSITLSASQSPSGASTGRIQWEAGSKEHGTCGPQVQPPEIKAG